jgi:queuine tRNA-ribosyltransferase
LPEEKPRHLLGIGEPEDLLSGIDKGVDLFDCVQPTRLGRTGFVYTSGEGKVNLLNERFREDLSPLDPFCTCPVCARYTRSYLAHLFRAQEMLGGTLASLHNVHFLASLVRERRSAIVTGGEKKERS